MFFGKNMHEGPKRDKGIHCVSVAIDTFLFFLHIHFIGSSFFISITCSYFTSHLSYFHYGTLRCVNWIFITSHFSKLAIVYLNIKFLKCTTKFVSRLNWWLTTSVVSPSLQWNILKTSSYLHSVPHGKHYWLIADENDATLKMFLFHSSYFAIFQYKVIVSTRGYLTEDVP